MKRSPQPRPRGVTRRAMLRLGHDLDHRLIPPMRWVMTPRRLRRIRDLPGPSLIRPLKVSPPWASPCAEPLPELATVPGIRRDDDAETKAFAERPLHDWFETHPEAVRWMAPHYWRSFLPVSRRLLRARRAIHHTQRHNPPPVSQPAGTDPAQLTSRLKEEARRLGISAVGVAPYDPRFTFAEYAGRNAGDRMIVCVLEQPWAATHAPGVIVRPLRQMNGDHHFSEVFLEDARVSDADRIGEVGEGWKIGRTVLANERSGMPGDGRSARSGGAWTSAPAWLAELAASGALGDDVLRDRAMTVYVSECVADLTEARAEANAKAGRAPGPEGSGQKLRAGAVFRQRAELIKDAGGLGGLLSTTAGHIEFLTAPSMSIRGGTDEIQRTIIGERILGLEREPSLDADKPWSQTRSGS